MRRLPPDCFGMVYAGPSYVLTDSMFGEMSVSRKTIERRTELFSGLFL